MGFDFVGPYIATLVVFFFIYNILTWGLNIQFGYAGIPNFTYITFMAVGAYVTGVLTLGPAGPGEHYILGLSWPFPLGLIAGGIAAAVVGAAIGLLILRRLRSDYLAIVMFALGFVAYDVVATYVPLFNGQEGIYGVGFPLNGHLNLSENGYPYFFIALSGVIMGLLWLVANRIYSSSFGRTLRAIREDKELAESLGKDSVRLRLLALIVGCFYGGIAGGLTIEFFSALNPSGWTAPETFIIWAALLLGGNANNLGSVLGSLIVPVGILEGTRFLPNPAGNPELGADLRFVLVGCLILAILWFRPRGILPEKKRRFYELPLADVDNRTMRRAEKLEAK